MFVNQNTTGQVQNKIRFSKETAHDCLYNLKRANQMFVSKKEDFTTC